METQNAINNELLELTNRICDAVANKDLEFIRENAAERINLRQSFFGLITSDLENFNQVCELKNKAFFCIENYDVFQVNSQSDKAKIVYEIEWRLNLSFTRWRGAFSRKSFHYLYSKGKWKLVEVDEKITWFSNKHIRQSIANLVGWIHKRGYIALY